jgi:hypothetical protein
VSFRRCAVASVPVALATGAVLVIGDRVVNDDTSVCPSTLTGDAGPCFSEGSSVPLLLIFAVVVAAFLASLIALLWVRGRRTK